MIGPASAFMSLSQHGRGMSMMEEGDDALGFERKICWLSGSTASAARLLRRSTSTGHPNHSRAGRRRREAGDQGCAVAAKIAETKEAARLKAAFFFGEVQRLSV
jgi:hypothetical protein